MATQPVADELAQSAMHRVAVLQRLRKGVDGYAAFQRTLADLISPAEAEAARHGVARAPRPLKLALLVLALSVPFRLVADSAAADNIVMAIQILGPLLVLVLVSCHRIPYAALVERLGAGLSALRISASLAAKLAEEAELVDSRGAAFEWNHIYEQFELGRLRRQLGGRYLFPVCLGRTLCAVICLGDGAGATKIARAAYAAPMAQVGLATLGALERDAHAPGPGPQAAA